ncbi:acylcarnitine hydrolase-like [Amphibalanus amphitrite]|uniref:acylcarnitine hydrolase-like n=1 Tax=Amphibalanus amphitrite TaxID=1232801 RepID=UPI001C921637|nr:acylcarnitine hydrolase-like [Amphibalanus amphitrite]
MRDRTSLPLLLAVLLCVCPTRPWRVTTRWLPDRTVRLGWLIPAPPPTVHTREGELRGLIAHSADGHLFYSFLGIPYARAPVRFRSPERHPGWSGVRSATRHGSKCVQWVHDDLVGSEDCLFANVYTRQLPASGASAGPRLPVMVFIHGGGFVEGHGDGENHGPRYFMDEDVVLVTFNYRLGPFGFFTTHDGHAPGNYGLRDQVLLLHWVRDNIAAFGGDPRAVTVFGSSAGAASVSLMVLSPLTKGLFHHAISQSGSAISSFAASGRRKGLARRFAAELGCAGSDSAAYVECAVAASARELMEASHRIRIAEIQTEGRFLPRVDRESVQPVLPDDPRALLLRGEFNLVPWMAGLVEEEGVFYLSSIPEEEDLLDGLYAGNLTLWSLLADLTTPSETSIVECGADPIMETHNIYHFLLYMLPAASPTNPLPFARLLSDRLFVASSSEEMRLASQVAPVYKYLLDHRGPGRLYYHAPVLPELGVTHSDELAYMFNREGRPLEPAHSPARTMIRFIVSLWTSFARTGRPSSDVRPMPDWPVYSEQRELYMRLNWEPSVDRRLFPDRVDFWQTVRINEPWRRIVEECD